MTTITTQFPFSTDAFAGAAAQATKSAEKLAALNVQTIQTLLSDFAASSQAALAAKSPDEFFKLQASALQAASEKVVAYGREVTEIFTTATAEQRAATESLWVDAQAKFLEGINGALKNVPGSESTIALVQSAVAATNSAYEGVNKVSKQVSDAVDANVTKFTATAVKSTKAIAKAA